MTPAELAAAVRGVVAASVDAGEFGAPCPTRSSSSGPRIPSTATTPPTSRCAWPRPPADRPARSPTRSRPGWRSDGIDRVDVAGPGFLNVVLARPRWARSRRNIVDAGAELRPCRRAGRPRINLEFVSANPTGPVHIGAVRWAAVGDALARLLQAAGAEVTREYYFNDAGSQIERFARTLREVANGRPVPEDGYNGDYIAQIASAVVAASPGPARARPRRAAGGVPPRRRRADVRRDQAVDGRLRRRVRRLLQRARSAHPGRTRRRPGAVARTGQHLRGRRRGVAAHLRATATTRTGCSCAARGSGPTSPPTAPTTWTSASAASTRSSSCSAPITTATSSGCARWPPASATIRTRRGDAASGSW